MTTPFQLHCTFSACRLQQVAVSAPEGTPISLVCEASSLDPSQARALAACLTQELALIQGPPGTGNTVIHSTCQKNSMGIASWS